MPQPIRNWYFEPEPFPPEAASSGDDDGIATGHRATCRLASRATAWRAAAQPGRRGDDPRLRAAAAGPGRRSSTAYRATTLLIPADLLRDDAVVGAINAALAPVGMSIAAPDLDSRQVRSNAAVAEALRRLPRVAGLVPAAPPPGKSAVPVVLDAWTALQTLRAAADAAVRADRTPAAAEGGRPSGPRPGHRADPGDRPPDRTRAPAGEPVRPDQRDLGSPVHRGQPLDRGRAAPAPTPTAAEAPAPRSRSACARLDRREPAALGCRRPSRRGPRHRCPRPPVAGCAAGSGRTVHRRPGGRVRHRRPGHPGRHLRGRAVRGRAAGRRIRAS